MQRNVAEQKEIVDNALKLGQYQGPARPRVHYVFLITVGHGKGCVRQQAVAREVHIVTRQLGLQDARRLAVVPRPDVVVPRPRDAAVLDCYDDYQRMDTVCTLQGSTEDMGNSR